MGFDGVFMNPSLLVISIEAEDQSTNIQSIIWNNFVAW